MDNRCTAWFDGWPTWLGGTGNEWIHCCQKHDEMYLVAHTFGEFVAAHWELCSCVATVSWGMAGTMFLGVLAGTFALGKKILPAYYWRVGKK